MSPVRAGDLPKKAQAQLFGTPKVTKKATTSARAVAAEGRLRRALEVEENPPAGSSPLRCHTCGRTFVAIGPAQRHGNEAGHLRIETVLW